MDSVSKRNADGCRSHVRDLSHFATKLRTDPGALASGLTFHASDKTEAQLMGVKCTLRYLKGNRDTKLLLKYCRYDQLSAHIHFKREKAE